MQRCRSPAANLEPAPLLESIALRHQIAVLERNGTRRPCFSLWDRLFWILLSHWWANVLGKLPTMDEYCQSA
jgi:hypothetical protein